ncbi:hypothetical protein [Allisonella histaminiformans]|uniref:hypothetical protein n=1 Tax=Allisonella histaminiformans TaxID=209880 RepID=UPI00294243B9|nr:hypothetical protein [Allisonella histaminiformans]
MIKEIYTRKQAIAEFINNNTGFIGMLEICKSLYKHDHVFPEYVWFDKEEFNHAVRNWNAIDIIKATPAKELVNMEFFHINEDTEMFSGATFTALCNYFDREHVRDKVIRYLVSCAYGTTGDETLDGIVSSTSDTMFDDSFYIYHTAEERPEHYYDGNF